MSLVSSDVITLVWEGPAHYCIVCLSLLECVKEVVKSKLLPAWLRLLEGKVLDLLHRLDVENCAEIAFEVLNALFSGTESLEELLQDGVSLDGRYDRVEECVTCVLVPW